MVSNYSRVALESVNIKVLTIDVRLPEELLYH